MCNCTKKRWIHADKAEPPKITIGEKGMTLMWVTSVTETPVIGEFTGVYYPFDKRQALYVDSRDAVFLLSDQFQIMEQ